jgi:hypothetical protein
VNFKLKVPKFDFFLYNIGGKEFGKKPQNCCLMAEIMMLGFLTRDGVRCKIQLILSYIMVTQRRLKKSAF